jgi:uncharacterized protein with PIN domain
MGDVSCPKCGHTLNAVMSLFVNAFPEVDDYTICAHCNTILQFEEDFSMRIAQHVPSDVAEQFQLFLRWKKSQMN